MNIPGGKQIVTLLAGSLAAALPSVPVPVLPGALGHVMALMPHAYAPLAVLALCFANAMAHLYQAAPGTAVSGALNG